MTNSYYSKPCHSDTEKFKVLAGASALQGFRDAVRDSTSTGAADAATMGEDDLTEVAVLGYN